MGKVIVITIAVIVAWTVLCYIFSMCAWVYKRYRPKPLLYRELLKKNPQKWSFGHHFGIEGYQTKLGPYNIVAYCGYKDSKIWEHPVPFYCLRVYEDDKLIEECETCGGLYKRLQSNSRERIKAREEFEEAERKRRAEQEERERQEAASTLKDFLGKKNKYRRKT